MERSKTLVLFLILVVILSFNLYELFLRRSPIPSASAVQAGADVGVYWDAGCTLSVGSISWGTLELGGTQQVVVYVRNEGNDTFNLDVATLDWQPGNVYLWLSFSWSCQNTTMAAGQVEKVTQTLHVPSALPGGFSSFSFNIVFEGGSYLLGDINKDGAVDIADLTLLAKAYNSKAGDKNWNPNADFNGDGTVDISDFTIMVRHYNTHYP